MAVTVRVNGVDHDLTTHDRSPVLWALRDELGCASAKYGCGTEQCGACRVLVDGTPASSCTLPLHEIAGREVTTLESLVADGRAEAVIAAVAARNAGQCGYCLPGMVTTLTALAERPGPRATDADVVRALDDHLCRCGAQPRILAAAREALGLPSAPTAPRLVAAGPDDEPAPPIAEHRLLGTLAREPELDTWLSLLDGRVVVRTGKAELGQGIHTAIVAVAADELSVDPAVVDVEGPATGTSPNELITAGSGSIEQSAMAVRQVCAHARRALLARGADRLATPAEDLRCRDGHVVAPDGRTVPYPELVGPRGFGVTVDRAAPAATPVDRRWSGRGLPRRDLPTKARGEPVFVHDLPTPDGAPVRHARVLRPGWVEHRLHEPADADALADEVRTALGVDVDVVVDGSFVAVLADREGDVELAAQLVGRHLSWEDPRTYGGPGDDPDRMMASVESSRAVVEGTATEDEPDPPLGHAGAATTVAARYVKPFLLHGSIGPSAGVAHADGSGLRIWSHSQGVELLRLSVAEALDLPADEVVARHVDGAGCYGHNGADDAAFDAALVAVHRPGTTVKVQWSRTDEHRLEPASPAMAVALSAGLDADGHLRSWNHDVYSYAHTARPFPMGPERSGLLATWSRADRRVRPRPTPSGGFHSGAHRNADPLYVVGARRVATHFVGDSPVRTSSTRGLGASGNVFAIESFVDELAQAAGVAPDRFRIDHLADPRAVEVIEAVTDLAGGLEAPGGIDAPGRGLAFARYENVKAYVAVVAEVAVDPRTGGIDLGRAWIAADAGEVIDPDGLANQLEGGFVQAASWTLWEELAVDGGRVTASGWEHYPILRFSGVPELRTTLLHRPGHRVLGAAEAVTGPTPAAIANAVFQATGARLRRLPLRPERVLEELDVLAGDAPRRPRDANS